MHTVHYLTLKYEPLKLANDLSTIRDINAGRDYLYTARREPLYLATRACDFHMWRTPGAC